VNARLREGVLTLKHQRPIVQALSAKRNKLRAPGPSRRARPYLSCPGCL